MIERYTDHAANERTYLAWIRTALAFMGFGLLVERFDLLVQAFRGADPATSAAPSTAIPAVAGLVLIFLGICILVISSHRYLLFRRLIATGEKRDFRASRTDLVLVGIVAAIALFMSLYLVSQAAG